MDYWNLKERELDIWHAELTRKQEDKEQIKKQRAILREQAKQGGVDAEEIEDEIEFKNAQLERAREIAQDFLGTENAKKSKEVAKLEREIASLKEMMMAAEKEIIVECLESVDGNRSAAAKILGLSRSSLYDRLEKYQI